MEINLLVKSLVRQIPNDIKWDLEDVGSHFVLRFIEPSQKFNNYFKKYYTQEDSNQIMILNNDYRKLIDLSLTLRRFCLDTN